MAVIYRADISPTKEEVVAMVLDAASLGTGPVDLVGGYRFDDPEGEVGVEALIARRDGATYHVPVTYRGAPLPGAEDALICTMEHSVLGRRWVHPAHADPVAIACFTRALDGGQDQATMEHHRPDGSVEIVAPAVQARRVGTGGEALAFTTDLAAPVDGATTLVATWADGEAVVAALR